MIHLISALQFLTLLPLGRPVPLDPVKMIGFFPAAGLIIGALLTSADSLFSRLWNPPVAALLDIVFLVVITASLHIDGLADTADGILGHRTRERALAIMKDSRIGAMGLICVLCTLSLKWAGISGIEKNRLLLLLLIPAYARGGILFAVKYLPYGRPEGGTGSFIFEKPSPHFFFAGLLPPVLLSAFLGWDAVRLNLGFILILVALIIFYRKRMGCVTGDMLGAMIEITESMLFLLFSVQGIS
ncbi:MAG: adenosylcobinamide-GDP ribazoletransferase [Thermodesulfobacteriota bacterium]